MHGLDLFLQNAVPPFRGVCLGLHVVQLFLPRLFLSLALAHCLLAMWIEVIKDHLANVLGQSRCIRADSG